MYPKGIFPCGKCLSCRIAKSREWASRLVQELPYWSQSVFVTLTYDDAHLPSDFGLHKQHLQLFIKRLRKRMTDFNLGKIKYFGCGEYGDENIDKVTGLYKYPTKLGRPHYHLIIFGLGNDKMSKNLIKHSWKFCQWSMLQDSKCFGSVTYDSCRYVSDYIFKKYNNEKSKEVYGDIEIPFRITSLGLGLRFALENKEQLKQDLHFTIRGVPVALPRYYVNKLEIELPKTGSKDIEKWKNYCRLVYGKNDNSFVADVFEQHKQQRAINAQSRADLHHKGDL